MRKTLKYLTVVIILYALCLGLYTFHVNLRIETGERLVNLMYNYNSLEELQANMEMLKEMTTEDVYRQLDINYDTRVINTYYKFKADPTEVIIMSSTDGSVYYRLDNPNVSETRTFLCRYELEGGKVSKVSEYELVEGIDNYGGTLYE